VEKQLYGNHSRRMNYQLTERGQSLRPVLKAMIGWGLEHIPDTQIPANEPENWSSQLRCDPPVQRRSAWRCWSAV